tara:strand:- start:1607 stop:2722 length:1116 start_codon:yes stop_codon:yes gene_type:complete
VRIAVDARPLARSTAGIGRYTDSLVSKLVPQGGTWYLYTDRPLLKDYSHLGDVVVRLPEQRRFPGALRAQTDFVGWAKTDAIDVFWSPRHHLPVFLPRKVKKLVTIHDLVWVRHPGSMKKMGWLLEFLLMPVSLLLADRIVSVSEFTASEMKKVLRVPAAKIEIIPLAPYDFDEGAQSGDNPVGIANKAYFLFVGTPEPRKNLGRLLEAFSNLLKGLDTSPALCIVGGHGWGGEETSDLVREFGLEKDVVLPGHVSDFELDQLYQHAMALVMPSLYEGFGLPILEAMRHGVPVITGNCSAMPEVAGDGALLVDPLSVVEIEAAMSKLYSEPAVRAELSENALAQARKFSWQFTADRTLTQIKQLASQVITA